MTLKASINRKLITLNEIVYLIGILKSTINQIYTQAIEWGFNPAKWLIKLLNKHVQDAPCSGRTIKDTEEN